jgi:serine/threonine protein kinase
MGCASSVNQLSSIRRSSKATIESAQSDKVERSSITQRYGHPAYYKADGYEIGLRFKIKSTHQSFFVGTARSNGNKVTVKEHHLKQSDEDEIYKEISILSKLTHANIPKISEVFITNISVFMVTDFIDAMRIKHFIDFKNKTTTFTINDTRSIIRSILSATAYCHNNGIIIRNLTADNIMVKKTGDGVFETKIADFSQAVEVGSTKVLCDHTVFEWADVPYMAPEALLGQSYSTPMDVWSIGVLLFTMLSAQLPFAAHDDQVLVEQIKSASVRFSADYAMSNSAKELIKKLVVSNASARLTCQEVMKSDWVVME